MDGCMCVCVKLCQRPHGYSLMYALVIVALEVGGTEGKHLLTNEYIDLELLMK